MGSAAPLVETDMNEVRAVFDANVFGLLALTQAVAPSMMRRRSGTIVNLASVVGFVPTPFAGAYSASKAAVVALSDTLRLELAPFGVRVVVVAPGAIRSQIGANNLSRFDGAALRLYAPFRSAIEARATASQGPKSTPAADLASVVAAEARARAPVAAWVVEGGLELTPAHF